MKHFTKPDGSIWAFEADGSQDSYITEDMTPVTDDQLAILRKPQQSELIANCMSMIKEARIGILSILDGMQVSALVKGDTASAQAIETAKQGLRDLTKIDLTPYATQKAMIEVIVTQYASLAAALPASARTAFAQVT